MARWLLVATLAALLSLSHAAVKLPCPMFSCKPASFFHMKFASSWDPSNGVWEHWLNVVYADPSDLEDDETGQQFCYRMCQDYNKDAKTSGDPLATYWQWEQTCEDGIGGSCYCYAADVCTRVPGIVSDEWMEEEGPPGPNYEPAANYTIGKICKTDITGDPHFTGFDGSHFEFSGLPNQNFAILSDAHIQVNGFFGGRYGNWDNRVKAMTWIRQVAIMWGHHEVIFTARNSASADYQSGYLESITVDGDLMTVSPHERLSAAKGELTVTWLSARKRSGDDLIDVYTVSIDKIVDLKLTLRPEVEILRTKDDANIHFSIDIDRANVSSNVHGVLGQTFRPDFAGRLSQHKLVYSPLLGVDVVPGDNAEGFIDGVAEDYLVKDLRKADCNFCRFARAANIDDETAQAIGLASGVVTDSFMSRKLLSVH